MKCIGGLNGLKDSGSSLRLIEDPPPSSNAKRSPSRDGFAILTHV